MCTDKILLMYAKRFQISAGFRSGYDELDERCSIAQREVIFFTSISPKILKYGWRLLTKRFEKHDLYMLEFDSFNIMYNDHFGFFVCSLVDSIEDSLCWLYSRV